MFVCSTLLQHVRLYCLVAHKLHTLLCFAIPLHTYCCREASQSIKNHQRITECIHFMVHQVYHSFYYMTDCWGSSILLLQAFQYFMFKFLAPPFSRPFIVGAVSSVQAIWRQYFSNQYQVQGTYLMILLLAVLWLVFPS